MGFYYYKTFKVPVWVIVNPTEFRESIIKWLTDKKAHLQTWPEGFKETIYSFKSRGWQHEIKENGQFTLNYQLLSLACVEHVKKKLHSNAVLEMVIPTHRINRKISDDFDYERLFATVLASQASDVLSQVFRVGETCHSEDPTKNAIMYVTKGPDDERLNPEPLITRISENVVTIGDGPKNTINLEGQRGYKKQLEEFFAQLAQDISVRS